MLLPEIDEKATIRGCKRKLREYPRWREIAHDSAEQRITQEFTFMPRGGNGVSRPVENIAVRRVDAMNELEAIEQAVSGYIVQISQNTDREISGIPTENKLANCPSNRIRKDSLSRIAK